MTATPDPDFYPELYASIPAKRLAAWAVDAVLILALALLALPFTAFTGIFFFPFLLAVISFFYRVVTLATGSATLGMRLMAMELRRADDRPFDLVTAVLHTTGYFLSIGMALVQIASIALMCTSARAQGLTDMVLGTVAINRRRGR